MGFALFAGIVLALVVLIRRRHGRHDVLAGITSEKPTFAVAPPLRSMTRKDEHRW